MYPKRREEGLGWQNFWKMFNRMINTLRTRDWRRSKGIARKSEPYSTLLQAVEWLFEIGAALRFLGAEMMVVGPFQSVHVRASRSNCD